MNYVIATIKNWNIEEYHARKNSMTGNPKLITDKQQLNKDFLKKIKPKYIFFPHWSWNVPSDILNEYECICFHMTDLPYGRGGSPLQNLIVNNKKKTVITALRMEKQIDAGPVYLKKPLMLDGKAQDIYKNSSKIIFNMIESMLQKGKMGGNFYLFHIVPESKQANIFFQHALVYCIIKNLIRKV